jgi:hypothetical protein
VHNCLFHKGDGSCSYTLKKNNSILGSGMQERSSAAKYSIAFQYLVLEEIIEE